MGSAPHSLLRRAADALIATVAAAQWSLGDRPAASFSPRAAASRVGPTMRANDVAVSRPPDPDPVLPPTAAPTAPPTPVAPATGHAQARLYRLPPIIVRADPLGPRQVLAPGQYALLPEALSDRIAGLEDVMRGVQALPGVGTASDLHGEFFVRGSGSNANAIYLDGIEIFFPYHILGFNSIFNPGLIESGEFYSGGAPAEYGDATGGVLALRSRGLGPALAGTTFGLSYLSGQVRAEGGDAHWGGALSLRRSYYDKLLQLVRASGGREVPTFHDVFARGHWQPAPGHLLSLEVLHAGDGMSLPRPELHASDFEYIDLDSRSDAGAASLRSYAALHDKLELGNQLTLASLYWRALLGPHAYLETTLGHVPQDFEFSLRGDNHESVSMHSRLTLLRQDLSWETRRQQGRAGWLAYRDDTRRRVSAYAGILTLRESNSSINLFDLKERYEIDATRRRDLGAAYVEEEWWGWPERLQLGAGVRYEHDGLANQDLWSPRLSAEWRPAPDWSLRATWGIHRSLRDKPMEVMPTRTSQPLGAERSLETTLGVVGDFAPGVQAGVTGFDKRLSELAYEAEPALYANGGSGRARGLELWMRLHPANRVWRADLDYTLSDVNERDPLAWRRVPHYYAQEQSQFWAAEPETPYTYHPFQDERHRLGVQALVRRSRWEFGLRYQLGSGKPYTPVEYVATDPLGVKHGIVGRKGSARYPAYHRLDVRVLRQLQTRWRVYAEILNVTAAHNVFQYRYNPSYTARYTVRMLPTLPTVGIEAHF